MTFTQLTLQALEAWLDEPKFNLKIPVKKTERKGKAK
jgi:hypothetical protein